MNPLRAALQYYKLRSAWLGAGGKPVSATMAYDRSVVCRSCPKHDATSPLHEFFAEAATAELRRQIEIRNEMYLRLDPDAEPHICTVCGCLMSLKVWVPLGHILGTADTTALPPNCWIKTEQSK